MHLGKLSTSLAAVGSLLLVSTASFGQMSPTTAPTSMPATEPVVADSTTPKGTLLVLSRATAAGDTKTVANLLAVDSEQDRKLADALMRRNIINVKFRNALSKSFGEEVATQMAGSASDDEGRIASGAVDIKDDTATVHMGDNGEPVNLVKTPDGWKLSLKGLTGDMKPEQIDEQLAKMKVVVDAIDHVTDEITAAKYKSPDDVANALRNRLMAAATPTTAPAAAPTTQP